MVNIYNSEPLQDITVKKYFTNPYYIILATIKRGKIWSHV